jgi:hypothetical protein
VALGNLWISGQILNDITVGIVLNNYGRHVAAIECEAVEMSYIGMVETLPNGSVDVELLNKKMDVREKAKTSSKAHISPRRNEQRREKEKAKKNPLGIYPGRKSLSDGTQRSSLIAH